jgi:hypothetical protein
VLRAHVAGSVRRLDLVSAGQDEPEPRPRVQEPADTTPSASTSPSPTLAPLAAPKPPTVKAEPGYRSVAFTLAAPGAGDGTGVTRHLEVNTGKGWKKGDNAVVPVRQGGDQACVSARTVARDEAGRTRPSKPARSCGRAEPRTVRLVRTDDACTAGAGCRWYNVYVAGFASGTSPQAFVYDGAGNLWCDCSFRRVQVGKDGRGAQVHEWQVTPGRFNSYVTLVVDGVRSRVFVP